MDMTTLNGERIISKYDIRAMKVGSKVPSDLRTDLNKFNSHYIGAESVFPVKNGQQLEEVITKASQLIAKC
jgi:hypothetical protein